jgi:nicotinamidase-related amidase
VVLVQHEEDEDFVYGSDAWQLGEGLTTADSDLRVRKTYGNAFKETRLHELLQELAVGELIVCGMQSDFCVDATVRGAVALGYPVTLISDGHSTLDSEGRTAAQIIAQRNEALSQLASVCVAAADEVVQRG